MLPPDAGKPMRAVVAGGKALIASNVKVAPAGANIDIPIGHKDEAWSFAHFDTITVSIADSPRPYEILVAIAASASNVSSLLRKRAADRKRGFESRRGHHFDS